VKHKVLTVLEGKTIHGMGRLYIVKTSSRVPRWAVGFKLKKEGRRIPKDASIFTNFDEAMTFFYDYHVAPEARELLQLPKAHTPDSKFIECMKANMSRVEIMKALMVSRSTVTTRVNRLIEHGFKYNPPIQRRGGGRPKYI
jgi:hypothetical protein